MANRTIVVVDVGTHKAQEARLLADHSLFCTLGILFRILLSGKLRPAAFSDCREILRLRRHLQGYEFRFCFVEPVLYRQQFRAFSNIGTFCFLRGVTSTARSGATRLFLAEDHLGNSIIETKPNLTDRSIRTWNYDFRELLDWAGKNLGAESADLFILRINAEGIEKQVIELLHETRNTHRLDAIFGSLGDIVKCYGEEAHITAVHQLSELNIPFYYFTAPPRGWVRSLRDFINFAEAGEDVRRFRKHADAPAAGDPALMHGL